MAIIPTEILISEILPRLPPRTLLQFKCLNKSLYDHISSKKFIDLHLKQTVSSTSDRLLMAFTAVRNDRKRCLYFVDANSPGSRPWYLPLPHPFNDVTLRSYATTVVGSCNGLLCVKASIQSNITCCWIILNPCTGKVSITISLSEPPFGKGCSGFGYDALNDDYKLVAVVHFPGTNTFCRSVRIYSMKANSWKTIDSAILVGVPLSVPPWGTNCVLINNHLMHWRFFYSTSDGPKGNIICFNLETEQWDADIPLPDFEGYCRSYADELGFGVLKGCLCLSINNLEDTFVGWIMKEYGVQESWTKFSIDVPAHRWYHAVFPNWKGATQDILLVTRKFHDTDKPQECYLWYNIRDKIVKKLEYRGAPDDLRVACLCVASLVTDFGERRTDKRKAPGEMQMKVDKRFKISLVNV